MANANAEEWLKIVIENFNDPDDEVSYETFMEILGSFGKLFYLMHGAMVHEPEEPLPRINRLRKEFTQSYFMGFRPPEKGSYSLSFRLTANVETAELSDDLGVSSPSPSELVQFLEKSVETVSNENPKLFWELFPDVSNSKRILQGIKSLQPASGYGCRLESSGHESRTIFNSEEDLNYVRVFENELAASGETQLHVEELTLIAPIEELNFKDETFKAVFPSGVAVDGSLTDVFHEDTGIFDKYLIEVDGKFRVDENNKVHSIQSEKGKRLVNTDPIVKRELVVENEHLVIDPPLRCEVEFDRDSLCYGLTGELDLFLYAYSRGELEDMLEETLQDWWFVYVVSDDEGLSESGKVKRNELMDRIKLRTKGDDAAD